MTRVPGRLIAEEGADPETFELVDWLNRLRDCVEARTPDPNEFTITSRGFFFRNRPGTGGSGTGGDGNPKWL